MPRSFRQSLVLHNWLLEQVSASVWDRDDSCNRLLKEAEGGAWDEESPFLQVLLQERSHPGGCLPDGVLRRLDADIVAITRELRVRRWLYFQYVALLFSGIYLDSYYADRERLRTTLNERVRAFNDDATPSRGRGRKVADTLEPYSLADLARLGCWQATGSGKTLLLHANRLQVLRYSRQYEDENRKRWPDARELLPPERTILLTPNRMLVTHHADEARAIGVTVDVFDPALPMTRMGGKGDRAVLGASISQFQPPGEKHTAGKVPPEYFPGRNLVMVDEGHRGSSKIDGQWRSIREALAEGGFLFEYSATLEQAAKGALRDYYARSIFIDYSYPKFYKDGYGKHHRILNLLKDTREARHDYLVASMVAFHQQLDVFETSEELMRRSNIERPLMLFAGRTVTGETKRDEDKQDRAEEADIVKLMRFFALFVSGFESARPMLEDVLAGKPGILTRDQRDLFASYFPEVRDKDGKALYDAMLRKVFRAPAPGRLVLEVLKDAQGEVGVKVGTSDEFFAVINVGKPDVLVEKLEKAEKSRIRAVPNEFRGGLFGSLKERDNRLTMLIGSKKFAEGWSSWRVAQIGLLHIGKGEGTQVIQLFGRGVRLKGKGGTLKRSSPPWSESVEAGSPESRLRVVETLNVFAVEATYLKRFEEQIEEMVKDDEDDRIEKELPVIHDERAKGKKLRLPVPPPKSRFVTEVALSLDPNDPPPQDIAPAFGQPHIEVDFTPRVQVAGDQRLGAVVGDAKANLRLVRAFADHDALYGMLQHLKADKGWTNLRLPRTVAFDGGMVPLTQALLADDERFSVRLPARYVDPAQVGDLRYLGLWNEIARRLVTELAKAVYTHCLRRWQTLNAKVQASGSTASWRSDSRK
jgi:hypothetical protein